MRQTVEKGREGTGLFYKLLYMFITVSKSLPTAPKWNFIKLSQKFLFLTKYNIVIVILRASTFFTQLLLYLIKFYSDQNNSSPNFFLKNIRLKFSTQRINSQRKDANKMTIIIFCFLFASIKLKKNKSWEHSICHIRI